MQDLEGRVDIYKQITVWNQKLISAVCLLFFRENRWQLHKNVAGNIEQVLVATPNKAPASHHENYPS